MRRLNQKFDVDQLVQDMIAITAKYPFGDGNQVGLTHMKDVEDKVYGNGAIGGTTLHGSDERLYFEKDFTIFNEEFRDMYIHWVYQAVNDWSPYGLGRVRLMRLRPRTCLSFHSDYEIRYHLALITNPRCFILTDKYEGFPDYMGILCNSILTYRIPADGHLYELDARKYHTAINGWNHDRIHLVFSTLSEYSNVDASRI